MAPYTRQTFSTVVGPGAYNHEKKAATIKDKILYEDAVQVPFHSSDARFYNKKAR